MAGRPPQQTCFRRTVILAELQRYGVQLSSNQLVLSRCGEGRQQTRVVSTKILATTFVIWVRKGNWAGELCIASENIYLLTAATGNTLHWCANAIVSHRPTSELIFCRLEVRGYRRQRHRRNADDTAQKKTTRRVFQPSVWHATRPAAVRDSILRWAKRTEPRLLVPQRQMHMKQGKVANDERGHYHILLS